MIAEFAAAATRSVSVDAKKRSARPLSPGRPVVAARGGPGPVATTTSPTRAAEITPYGVYDIAANRGSCPSGTGRGTAALAVERARRGGSAGVSCATRARGRLLVTCDAGGSNGCRSRLWKDELAVLAAETGLEITVCHFPPGTSKWNKIEHRLFCHITRTWRARPLDGRRRRGRYRRDRPGRA